MSEYYKQSWAKHPILYKSIDIYAEHMRAQYDTVDMLLELLSDQEVLNLLADLQGFASRIEIEARKRGL